MHALHASITMLSVLFLAHPLAYFKGAVVSATANLCPFVKLEVTLSKFRFQ